MKTARVDLEKGKLYRVMKNGAELVWNVLVSGGYEIKGVELPIGAEIEYIGHKMGWGSDNISTPNFSWKGKKGSFHPENWGRIDDGWIIEVGSGPIASELMKIARELVSGFGDMTLKDMDNQAAKFVRDLEDNGWYEKGGIAFYQNRKYPLIYVDANGLSGQVLSLSNSLFEEYVETYQDLQQVLRSRDYLKFVRNSENINALSRSGDWKLYRGQGVNMLDDVYVNAKYPGVAVWAYTPDATIRIQPITGRGVELYSGASLGVAKNFGEMERMVKLIDKKEILV